MQQFTLIINSGVYWLKRKNMSTLLITKSFMSQTHMIKLWKCFYKWRNRGGRLKYGKTNERTQICGRLGLGDVVQEIGWGVSGSCQELSDWLQMEEVTLRDPGSGHWGHSRLTSSAVFQHQRPPSGILFLPANQPSLPLPLLSPSSTMFALTPEMWHMLRSYELTGAPSLSFLG